MISSDKVCSKCGLEVDKFVVRTRQCYPCVNAYKRAHAKRKGYNTYANRKKYPWHTARRKEHMSRYLAGYRKKRYHSDLQFRLRHIMRSRLHTALKRGRVTKVGSSVKLLGCGTEQLITHLESQFTPQMNWSNYGLYWSIDHIKPLASFDLSNLKHLKKAMHYTNLQPLTVRENSIKGSRG